MSVALCVFKVRRVIRVFTEVDAAKKCGAYLKVSGVFKGGRRSL